MHVRHSCPLDRAFLSVTLWGSPPLFPLYLRHRRELLLRQTFSEEEHLNPPPQVEEVQQMAAAWPENCTLKILQFYKVITCRAASCSFGWSEDVHINDTPSSSICATLVEDTRTESSDSEGFLGSSHEGAAGWGKTLNICLCIIIFTCQVSIKFYKFIRNVPKLNDSHHLNYWASHRLIKKTSSWSWNCRLLLMSLWNEYNIWKVKSS